MLDHNPSQKRHRGGQPGNVNALKHGFYTRRFTHTDLAGVESIDYNGLIEEITIIRLYARRLIELDTQSADISQVANILRILCLASLTITRLVKTSQFLQSGNDSTSSDLHRALQHLTEVLKLDQLDAPPLDNEHLPQFPSA
ncbi:MAG: hypothetical protein A2Y88_06260 [Chloroflexi bacterium RBG_13_48_10]|nr:MAG: hypothetical protein A2Y88_06260 [Chloroflexi bacterium RBG_13_48_10]